ncbi:lipoyl synthase [Geomonas sp. RF6]|uniref:lipoyl synthase n=1 Tax=Geomonas sp. RF6 TaxID=2897342 RepID=UPI0022AA855D|nr:lipoyl synthase [Geomonas sp. RF6]
MIEEIGQKSRQKQGASHAPALPKPKWLKVKSPCGSEVERITGILRKSSLNTVCEEANCPNMGECFRLGTATFMIMGAVCTRRCPFCDVAHGRPAPLDADEPQKLAGAVQVMGLKYAVVTSVTRDDLPDGGAGHFASCIKEVRQTTPSVQVEILVPDFRGKLDLAFESLAPNLPDVFNHNLETVPRLYPTVRPGAEYRWSLNLLRAFAERFPDIPTKSGLMVGLGESLDEVAEVMRDLREHGCRMLTIGQYLRPSLHHLPVVKYVTPGEFSWLEHLGGELGFSHVEAGPLVRSSYHAEGQAKELLV